MTTVTQFIYKKLKSEPDIKATNIYRLLRDMYGKRFTSYKTVHRVISALQTGDMSILKQRSRLLPALPDSVTRDFQLPDAHGEEIKEEEIDDVIQEGKEQIVHNGCLFENNGSYTSASTGVTSVYWRCAQYYKVKCSTRVTTGPLEKEGYPFQSVKGEHKCTPQPALAQGRELISAIKRKAVSSEGVDPSSLVAECIRGKDEAVVGALPSAADLVLAATRARKKARKAAQQPASLDDAKNVHANSLVLCQLEETDDHINLNESQSNFTMDNLNLLVRSRCPGKLILSGEHATVYGKNAVAITVDLYTEVTVCIAEDERVTLTLDSFDFERSWSLEELQQCVGNVRFLTDGHFVYGDHLLAILGPLLETKNEIEPLSPAVYNSCLAFLLLYLSTGEASVFSERKALRVEVTSRLPNGAGLGSSSSYIVALAKALFTAHNLTQPHLSELSAFNRWCYEVDKIFHGRPSGIDNSICTHGGAILFGNGEVREAIESASLADLASTPVLLVNTNVARSTKVMVERCRARLNAYPQVVGAILDSIAALSSSLWGALKNKKLDSLPTLFTMNQHLLECLDVGHEKIDQVVGVAKRHGLTAKLTGAGGGGIVLIYLADKTDKEWEVITDLQQLGFTTYQVKLGVSGAENF